MAFNGTAVRQGLTLILIALGVRAAVVGAGVLIANRDLSDYAGVHGGTAYQAYSEDLDSLDALRAQARNEERLFPGYPALIRLMSWALPIHWAALMATALSVGVAVLLFYRMCGDFWLAAWFAVFPPSWVFYSAMAMSEALFLAVAVGAFLLWRKGYDQRAGLILGLLVLIRPVGALVFAALWLARLTGPNKQSALKMAAWFLLAPVVWLILAEAIWDDPLRRFYGAMLIDYRPSFTAFVAQMVSAKYSLGRKALVLITLIVQFAALVSALRDWIENKNEDNLGLFFWILFVSLFILALPESWILQGGDRFLLACLPPAILALRWALPSHPWALAAAAVVAVGLSGHGIAL